MHIHVYCSSTLRHTCTYIHTRTLPHNEHIAVVDGPILILEVEWFRVTTSLWRSVYLCDLSVVLYVELQMISKVMEVAQLMGEGSRGGGISKRVAHVYMEKKKRVVRDEREYRHIKNREECPSLVTPVSLCT